MAFTRWGDFTYYIFWSGPDTDKRLETNQLNFDCEISFSAREILDNRQDVIDRLHKHYGFIESNDLEVIKTIIDSFIWEIFQEYKPDPFISA